MEEQSIAALFEEDHSRLDRLFKKFQQMKHTEPKKAESFFKEFKVGLEQHILWEEQILFPIFEEKTGMNRQGPTEVMRIEHQGIKRLLGEIDSAICAANASADQLDEKLFSTLKEHNMKEERVLYPSIDQLVSAQEYEEVLKKTFGKGDKSCACCGMSE